jgi:hypothetical protein
MLAKLRASHLLGRALTAWTIPPASLSLMGLFFFFFCGAGVWTQGLYHHSNQPFFMKGFFKIGSPNYLPGLASNHDPPDLCLLSS